MSYKTEFQSNNADLQAILKQVNSLPESPLPTLSNPATAENVESGYEAIDSEGNKLTGTLTLASMLPTMTNPATAVDVASGKQFVDNTGAVVVGTADPNAVTIELTFSNGSGNTNNYIKIGDTTYTKNTTLQVAKGTSIYVLTYDTSNKFDGKAYNTNEKTFIADCSYTIAFTTWGSTNGTVEITSQPNDSVMTGTTTSLTISNAIGKKNIFVYLDMEITGNGSYDLSTSGACFVCGGYIDGLKVGWSGNFYNSPYCYSEKSNLTWNSVTGKLTIYGKLYSHGNWTYRYIAW